MQTYSIRITKPDGTFGGYLSHKGRKEWSKRQAQRHVADAKQREHFAGHTFKLEAK